MSAVALTRLRMDELVNAWVGDENTPFQLALLGTFDASPFARPDGTIDVPRISHEVACRARRVPALGRRVLRTRPGEGRPLWAPDPAFDAAAHVECTRLPPGFDLPTWAANRAVRPLDLARPLWRAEVVHDLPDGRFALLLVVHHIVADGLAGIVIAGSLLDPAPDAVPRVGATAAVPPLPSHRDLVRERRREAFRALRRLRPPALPTLPRLARSYREARAAMADFRGPEPATSLPRDVGPARRLAIVRAPLSDLRRAGHALGVTVNDLLLAAVAGGLRDLLIGRDDPVAGRVLRTTVPAGTGRPGQALGVIVVGLPVGEPDPFRRLALIHDTTTAGKAKLQAGGGDVTDMLRLPIPLARQFVRRGRRYGSRRITLSVTDVIGPPAPLWLAGARLVEAVPIAPLVPLVPLCVAALSYAGELTVSVNADDAVDDLGVMADGMAREFAVLSTAP